MTTENKIAVIKEMIVEFGAKIPSCFFDKEFLEELKEVIDDNK